MDAGRGDVVMSVEEVADFLGVGRNLVYEACGRMEIPHRRVGRRLLFLRSALVAWLECRNADDRTRSESDVGLPR